MLFGVGGGVYFFNKIELERRITRKIIEINKKKLGNSDRG